MVSEPISCLLPYLPNYNVERIKKGIGFRWLGKKTPLDARNSSSIFTSFKYNSLKLVAFAWTWILANKNVAVKKPRTRGQFAWVVRDPSETTRGVSPVLSPDTKLFKIGNKKHSEVLFEEWLVGIVDGDGTFHFSEAKPGQWTFYFKVAQSSYNLRLLYHIKSRLGVGEVRIGSNDMAEFRIRDSKKLLQYIIPIFDHYFLLTSKYYYYNLFKKGLLIFTNPNIPIIEKRLWLAKLKLEQQEQKEKIKQRSFKSIYFSPAWKKVNNEITCLKDAESVMSKSWLIGFTEAEGSFYLYNKDINRISHAFEITQKLDRIVLEAASYLIMSKTTPLRVKDKATYFSLRSDSIKEIPFIALFYQDSMRGMKSLEFRIWFRSFVKMSHKKDRYAYLKDILDKMRKIRSIRLDKTFNMVIKNNK